MRDLLHYLNSNFIAYDIIAEGVLSIGDQTYEYVHPLGDVYFDSKFHLQVRDTECDYYIILFGGRYYRIKSTSRKLPTLELLRYVGESTYDLRTLSFLGVHGAYEICNGTRLYHDWVAKAKFLKLDALGICEKNTMAGFVQFQLACQKEGIKAILGATYTVYRSANDLRYDLKCFVKDVKGYQNLLKINTEVNCKPDKCIEEQKLMSLTEGLIFVMDPKSLKYDDIFPLDLSVCSYYQLDTVEYQKNEEDEAYLKNLKKYLFDKRLNPVAITDAYYLDKDDAYIKPVANAIINKFDYVCLNQHFKSKSEYYLELKRLIKKEGVFYQLFNAAIQNESAIVKACNFTIPLNERKLPKYEMTLGQGKKFKSNIDLFWYLIQINLRKKINPNVYGKYLDRIEKEYKVIVLGGVIDYFLILWDIIEWCNRNNILTGVGRGSAGGCLIAYLLGIIKIDPIEHGLFFERFLNPGRVQVSLPDIDIDFPSNKRDDVKKYIEERYGVDQVCSVGTYNKLKVKSLLKDLARQKNEPAHEMNQLTSLLSIEKEEFTEIIKNAVKYQKVKDFVNKYPDLINQVPLLLNQPKSESIHASAVIVIPEGTTVYESFPVKKMLKNDISFLVSEIEGEDLEKLGYLKLDILGILQLDKFQHVIDSVYEKTGQRVDLYNLPLDDAVVYQYFANGWNSDVFHFGTKLLENYCRQMKPENIKDLINVNGLNRPGAIKNNFHNQFLICRKDHSKIKYLPKLEEVTKDTNGLIIYQEQTMKAFEQVGGFSLVEADNIRKAMGKKISELLNSYREQFINGAEQHGLDHKQAVNLWNKLKKFSGYAFNKSHATAYSIMGYYSQYLKVHYPIYFWAASFKFINDAKRHLAIPRYIGEIKKTGFIKLMPANINKSYNDIYIDIDKNVIYWTLESIYYCGEAAIEQILANREKDGEYFSFDEFLDRNIYEKSKVNKRVVENMILSGVFDEIESVKEVYQRFDLVKKYREKYAVKVPYNDLFLVNEKYLQEAWWFDYQQKRLSEFGFINYKAIVESYTYNLSNAPYMIYENIMSSENIGDRITVAGYILEVNERESKNGVFANILLDINYDFLLVTVWPQQYNRIAGAASDLKKKILIVKGIVTYDDFRGENCLKTYENSDLRILS